METQTEPQQETQAEPQTETETKKKFNKKKLLIVIAAAVVLVALAIVGILLLSHSDESVSGSLSGTISADTVQKPENMDDMTFGIVYSKTYPDTELGGSGSGGLVKVKNGEQITLSSDGNIDYVEVAITRYSAKENYDTTVESMETVYTERIPASLTWNMADILSSVAWSDDLFDGHDIETTYYCEYTESCLGQFYVTEIRVYCPDGIGKFKYWVYQAAVNVQLK